ncbi:SRPBCC family protein [Cellulomonas fengjieae]|uniref:SRPBCC domain-containing protein n=1 Tax=Cellulomonas fengjieae TaxID=2819978 RepID=A0ABS3SHS7_9CELL|nr:SRPBCC domain-containing protein [Cellulomonas fengjieae]MBO3085297.1 SRPBCC domain-containing protein [Cellulomonas fengjieae]MBO3101043.1 SRPBCC domain-containing protein [Cellulomonas fengjieae]QVI66144.1 SRPBCC domain-containing protein [Cellulomonas fengjieae]
MADYATSIQIDAPPTVVFAHLVVPARMVAWMGHRAILDAVPGGEFCVDIGGSQVRGQYLEVEPDRRVVVSWGMAGSEDLPPSASRVEFVLTPVAGGTRVDLSHTGLPEARAAGHADGWAHFLTRLSMRAAGDDPGPDTWSS